MLRRSAFVLVAIALATSVTSVRADQATDIEGVKAASKAFYEAVVVVDDGQSMENVWAKRPYVTYIGPRSRTVIIGWDEQKKYWPEFNKPFSHRTVSLVEPRVHVVGDLAWEIGTESGEAHMKDGSVRKVDWFVTNVYERIDGRWLMVSHHVQPKPQ